jgi:hypothetical protein
MRYEAVITVTNKIATKKQYFLLSSESDKDPSRLVSLKILRTRGQSFRVLVSLIQLGLVIVHRRIRRSKRSLKVDSTTLARRLKIMNVDNLSPASRDFFEATKLKMIASIGTAMIASCIRLGGLQSLLLVCLYEMHRSMNFELDHKIFFSS